MQQDLDLKMLYDGFSGKFIMRLPVCQAIHQHRLPIELNPCYPPLIYPCRQQKLAFRKPLRKLFPNVNYGYKLRRLSLDRIQNRIAVSGILDEDVEEMVIRIVGVDADSGRRGEGRCRRR